MNPIRPPRWASALLRWWANPNTLEEVEGDLLELYNHWRQTVGKQKADWRYAFSALKLLRPLAKRKNDYPTTYIYSPTMLRNYFKIAFRNLLKHKGYSFINIFGLATGMSVAMLIGLWIWDELSYNKNYQNYDRIAKVMQHQTFNGEIQTAPNVPMQLAPELQAVYGSNFKHVVISGWTGQHLLSFDEKKIKQSGNYMGPEVTEMLSLKMLKGTRAGLKEPNSILLSESAGKAIFGNADPMDKIIKIDNQQDVKVTGVYEDLPYNSSFHNLLFIAPWDLMAKDLPKWLQWGNNWFQMFAQIADNTTPEKVSSQIKKAKQNNISQDQNKYKPEIFLLPMSKWHLYSEFKNGINTGGRIEYVWLFGIIGAFVLLLACINFMNLSTARSEKRAKEVGIRKAVGSVKGQLVLQFFGESLLVVLFAFTLSLLLVGLCLPFFNEVVDKKITILWLNPFFWVTSIGFILFTSLLAGSYPALYLSSFRPIKVLKGTFKLGRFASTPRKVLVVVQFTVSVTLIIGTVVVFRQIQFAKNRPIGYNRNLLLTSSIKTDEIIKHYSTFRDDLLTTGAVEELAATDSPITDTYVTNGGFKWRGKDPNMSEEFVTLRITHEFGKTINWQIKEGRDFSKEFSTDTSGFILNEAAVKYMGLKNPINEIIQWGDSEKYKVIGVVKDMVTQSPYDPAKQTIFFLNYKRINQVTIKLKPQVSASDAVAKIEAVFKKYDPENPFEYRFADQEFDKKFSTEERVGKLATFFATLAILISCLGLFGLASFVAEQRTKEIGVRKVLGATVLNLWGLLSKDFIGLIFISFLIAGPIAYYFLNDWLHKYEYRTEISWWIFAASGIGALLITLMTISFQAIKAALMNPVKSLRSE